jgi:hypothetical protein
MRTARSLLSASCLLTTLALPSLAHAALVAVDPGDAQVTYRTSNPALYNVTGYRTADFTPGNHYVCVGLTCIPFAVDTAGSVSGAANPSVDFVGNTVRFKPSVLVAVDPGDAQAFYRLSDTPLYDAVGHQTVRLVPGTSMLLRIGNTPLTVSIGPDGTVSGPANASLTFAGNTVFFRPSITVTVDPSGAEEQYRVHQSALYNVFGPGAVRLVPDTEMNACIAATCFPFFVHANGTVSGAESAPATFTGSTLTFRPWVSIAVDPRGADVQYRVHQTLLYNVFGPGSVRMVPGTGTHLCVASTCFPFSINADGTLAGASNASVEFSTSTIAFHTVPVVIEPQDASVVYRLVATSAAYNVSGTHSVDLVPGVSMQLCSGSSCVPFVVSNPLDLQLALGGTTFHLYGGVLDGDGDGVLDDADNCPQTANPSQTDSDGDGAGDACDGDWDGDSIDNASDNCPILANSDQVDRDIDGVGDVCDSDLDGDGFANATDNCPDVANDQADLDSDGAGDACDDDADGDLVSDATDNCPGDANPVQTDSDIDGLGDACDSDDDGDGVTDTADNCPFVTNASQADFDTDGEGDACDGDADSDTVGNADDQCAETALGAPVDATGCSATQQLDRACAGPFKNHGAWVSCVAHVSQSLVGMGLMSAAERARVVTLAARKP